MGNTKTSLSRRLSGQIGIFSVLNATDALVMIFYCFLTLLTLVFAARIASWPFIFAYNLLFMTGLFFLAGKAKQESGKGWKSLHFWYPLPMILVTYKEMHVLVHSIRQVLFDAYLINFDRLLFGADPTAYLYRFASPLLTEVLQIVYVAFYILPILLGAAMLRRKRIRSYEFTIFLILYSFFLSYIGYVIFPAIGPRFTLHDFTQLDKELPGLVLTPYFRDFVNMGESITSNMSDAALFVQRDVFPSGHTLVTLTTIYLSIRLRTRARFFLIPVGLILIFSTVYLRYHYVADLFGASVFFLFAAATGRRLFNFWEKLNKRNPYTFRE